MGNSAHNFFLYSKIWQKIKKHAKNSLRLTFFKKLMTSSCILFFVLWNLKNAYGYTEKYTSSKLWELFVLFVFVHIIQKFYWLLFKVILCFQKVMRINTGVSLSNTRNHLWGILANYLKKGEQIKTSQSQKRRKIKNSQSQMKCTSSYKSLYKFIFSFPVLLIFYHIDLLIYIFLPQFLRCLSNLLKIQTEIQTTGHKN